MFKFYTHTVIRHLWNEWSIKKLKHWKRLHSSPFLHAGRGVQRTTVHKIWQNTRGTLAVRPTDQPDESGSHCTAAVVPLSPPSLLFSSRHPVSRFLLQFGLQHPAVLPSFLPAVLPSFLFSFCPQQHVQPTNRSNQRSTALLYILWSTMCLGAVGQGEFCSVYCLDCFTHLSALKKFIILSSSWEHALLLDHYYLKCLSNVLFLKMFLSNLAQISCGPLVPRCFLLLLSSFSSMSHS